MYQYLSFFSVEIFAKENALVRFAQVCLATPLTYLEIPRVLFISLESISR